MQSPMISYQSLLFIATAMNDKDNSFCILDTSDAPIPILVLARYRYQPYFGGIGLVSVVHKSPILTDTFNDVI